MGWGAFLMELSWFFFGFFSISFLDGPLSLGFSGAQRGDCSLTWVGLARGVNSEVCLVDIVTGSPAHGCNDGGLLVNSIIRCAFSRTHNSGQ